jgi:hypothetical protein
MARVIATNTRSNVAAPVSDTAVTTPSVDFGGGDDFGNGWGDGSGGGGTTFFNQRVKAKRVAHVSGQFHTAGCKRPARPPSTDPLSFPVDSRPGSV